MPDGLEQGAGLLPLVTGAVIVVLAVASPTPGTPVDEPSFDPDDVTPGLTGFLATAGMVVLAILLFIDMARRLRRIKFRGELEERSRRAEQDAVAQTVMPDAAGAGAGAGEPDVVVLDSSKPDFSKPDFSKSDSRKSDSRKSGSDPAVEEGHRREQDNLD